jgi:hypothetical protein
MKDLIKFNAIGGLTFFDKPAAIQVHEEGGGSILPILGLMSIVGGIFWSDIEKWLKRTFL